MTFGERLTQLRKENGYLKRNDFAEKLGIPSTTLRNYETDAREPGHTFLKQISDIFNVSLDYLLGITDEKERLVTYNLKSSEYELIQKVRFISAHDDDAKALINTLINYLYDRAETLLEKEIEITNLSQSNLSIQTPSANTNSSSIRTVPYYNKLASAGTGQILWDDLEMEDMEIPNTEKTRYGDFALGVIGDSMEPIYWNQDTVLVQKTQDLQIGEVGIFILDGECFIKELGYKKLISKNPDYAPIEINDNSNLTCAGKVLCNLSEHSNAEIAYMYERRERVKKRNSILVGASELQKILEMKSEKKQR